MIANIFFGYQGFSEFALACVNVSCMVAETPESVNTFSPFRGCKRSQTIRPSTASNGLTPGRRFLYIFLKKQ